MLIRLLFVSLHFNKDYANSLLSGDIQPIKSCNFEITRMMQYIFERIIVVVSYKKHDQQDEFSKKK